MNSTGVGVLDTTPCMQTVIKAAKEVKKRTNGDCYVQANIDTGPYSLASVLRGAQEFIFDLFDESPKNIHEFLKFCTDVVVAYGEAMIETGVDAIQMGDATSSLLGIEHFKEYALPYLHDALERLQGKGADLWVHICGQTTHLLPYLKSLPMDGFEVDALVNLKTAKDILGDSIAIKGNLDTTFLLRANPEEVYNESLKLLNETKLKTGLIFSAGCGVPKMTSEENLHALVRAVKDYDVK